MPDITEKKTDTILDENGNALDKDGNQKKLSADYMSADDVNAIVAEFSRNFTETIAALDLLEQGASFNRAADALTKLEVVISGGPHVDFAKKNSWIANPAQRTAYLTSGIDQGIADKQFIIDFYKLVVGTQDVRAAFTKFLSSCRLNVLFFVYLAYCYEYKMKQIATFDALYTVSGAFVEFDSIYNTYNDGDIYKTLPGSKSQYPDGEYRKMVVKHMSTAIGKKARLKKFLKDALTVSPEALNNMYILDKETKAFDFFATTVDSMKQKIDDCSALNDLLASKEVIVGDGLWDYMAGYRKLLEKMLVVLEGGVKIIETFKTEKNKAPYAVLHYDPYVKDVVSKHMLGTLSDPITSGTNYKTMARKMVDRLDELAWTVTKYAPD